MGDQRHSFWMRSGSPTTTASGSIATGRTDDMLSIVDCFGDGEEQRVLLHAVRRGEKQVGTLR
jgi:hypothetical protein